MGLPRQQVRIVIEKNIIANNGIEMLFRRFDGTCAKEIKLIASIAFDVISELNNSKNKTKNVKIEIDPFAWCNEYCRMLRLAAIEIKVNLSIRLHA